VESGKWKEEGKMKGGKMYRESTVSHEEGESVEKV